MKIQSVDALRRVYAQPGERAVKKQLAHLDAHIQRFIALSPFVVVSSSSATQQMDASPRGGAPGFVKVGNDTTLWLPDASGNNRLDTLENIIATGQIGLLFLIPGVDETLRVNGHATVSTSPALLAKFSHEARAPKAVIEVTVREAYLHCAKAMMRAKLWQASSQVERSALPSMGQMIKDQAGLAEPAETQEAMVRRYQSEL